MKNILAPATSSLVFLILQSPRIALGAVLTALTAYLWCRAVDWFFDRRRATAK